MDEQAVAARDVLRATRQSLHDLAIAAMKGVINTVPHVERRVSGTVVAPCPIAEAIAEATKLAVVSGALLHALRWSRCPEVEALRDVIADAYAHQQAPEIVAAGGLS